MEEILAAALRQGIGQMALDNEFELSPQQLEDICAQLQLEKPPKPEFGDWACPCFPLAKIWRQAPPKLAAALATKLPQHLPNWEIERIGAYLNFRLPRAAMAADIMQQLAAPNFADNKKLEGQKITLEFSSPNTNKPLHLGHLRNNVLGEALGRILTASGATVNKVNLINDRGVHICKSMLAYQRFAGPSHRECNGRNDDKNNDNDSWETPENSNIKGDHLVGNYYVRFNNWQKKEAETGTENPEQLALQMLKDWENGETKVRVLWQKMRQWALDGIEQTYRSCDISFDRLYFESETYKLGRELVAEGLERGLFTRRADGAVYIDLSAYKLEQKIVQRHDGTSVYITQDLGTAVARYKDCPFDRQIYVVGNEQDYHFKVLFRILRLFGYPWAEQLYHLSYGMVVLPDGKMKSREGTVVDADILLEQLQSLALEGQKQRQNDAVETHKAPELAQKIALAALHFYLLQFNPQRDISFNPRDSLSFNGNTGPYLQYVGARIHSILKKIGVGAELASERLATYTPAVWRELVTSSEDGSGLEWELLKQLRTYPSAVSRAAAELNPSYIIKNLSDVARCFSRFYHGVPIIGSAEPLLSLRLDLCRATLRVLQNGMRLCVIPFLETM